MKPAAQRDRRWRSLDLELRERFGGKVAKLSLDAGFTCPTRDGRLSAGGCRFCGARAAGDFCASGDIRTQIERQRMRLSAKWTFRDAIAYFQSGTGTYAPVETLRERYGEALGQPGISGLAVATRPDCLPEDVMILLTEFSSRTFLWVELGLQTTNPAILRAMDSGFDMATFDAAAMRLKQVGIPMVAHLIAGLPGDTREGFLRSVRHAAMMGAWGVKLQMMHVVADSRLGQEWKTHPFPLLTREEYVEWICDALEILPQEVVIHRLTGDGSRDTLLAPDWTKDKLRVLSAIEAELRRRGTRQGSAHA